MSIKCDCNEMVVSRLCRYRGFVPTPIQKCVRLRIVWEPFKQSGSSLTRFTYLGFSLVALIRRGKQPRTYPFPQSCPAPSPGHAQPITPGSNFQAKYPKRITNERFHTKIQRKRIPNERCQAKNLNGNDPKRKVPKQSSQAKGSELTAQMPKPKLLSHSPS